MAAAWAAATNGKGKGKGKGKASTSAEGGKGHTLPRTRLSAEKFSGTVIAWKGKYGWIKPSEEIEHPKAALRNGDLFASKDDISGAEYLEEGAPVSFHIWEDDSGLGAEEVVQTGPAPAGAGGKGKAGAKGGALSKGKSTFSKGATGTVYAATAGKAAAKGKSWGPSAWEAWGGAVGTKGAWSPSKGWPGTSVKGWSAGAGKAGASVFGKAAEKGKGEKGKGKGKMGGKGHLLPRTRISAEKFTGTVSAWKGKYGWIQPAEEITHEKAAKHNGGLFVSKDDLTGDVTELTVGATVEFHIWEDPSGLGAEEVVQY